MMNRPAETDYPPYFANYVSRVPEGDLLSLLESQGRELDALLRHLTDEQGMLRYAPGKWSLKELLGHISDTERIMAGRALRFARGDRTPLPGFDQDPYIAAAQSERLSFDFLLEEFGAVRKASLLLFKGLPEEAWSRFGILNAAEASVLSFACIIYGHTQHHLNIVKERYLPAM